MLTCRQATSADLRRLPLLMAEIMEYHGVVPPARDRLETILTRVLEATDHRLLVAESDGQLVGMCALIFSYSTWSASLVCEVQDVLVTKSHRRGKVGRRLIEAAESLARARGCSRLFLLAEAWNLGAHSFYRSLGFTEKTCLDFERDLTRQEPGEIPLLP